MDAHTFFVRGGVFANVQTGNVILFAIDLSARELAAAMAHVWPILAFIVGALASHIKSGRVERVVTHPLRWTMVVQVVALVVIGFVPVTVAHSYVTVPIAFLAAVQMGLFRNIGDLAYLPVATTGNLMRFVESGYDGLVGKQHAGPVHRRRAGTEVTYHPWMVRRVLIASAVTVLGVAWMPGVVSANAEAGAPPCAFTLSPPHVVQVSGRDMVTATVDPAGCVVAAEPTLSVACVQMQGSQSTELCDSTEGPGTAQVYYAPYRAGATYTATGRGCASTGNPPRSICQTSGPLTATL
ncbi:MAG: hypothetical protein QOH54_4684 [Mycobacterium sp.]|nr:hypothetical protein [Mycobacterium sp.]